MGTSGDAVLCEILLSFPHYWPCSMSGVSPKPNCARETLLETVAIFITNI